MNYSEVYFAVASVATIAVGGLVIMLLMYALSIAYDVKKLSKLARKEAEILARGLARGASMLGSELSLEAQGFLRTLFTLLLSQFVPQRTKSTRKTKIKSI